MEMDFPGPDTYYNYQQAVVALSRARDQLAETRNKVEEAIAEEMAALAAAGRAAKVAEIELRYAYENYRMAKLRYEEKIETFDAVKRANDDLREAETEYFGATRGQYQAWAALLSAMNLAHNLVAQQPRRGPEAGRILENETEYFKDLE